MKGCFVAFEGVDGAGTTTQRALVADVLRGLGHRVHTTQEPSDGFLGAHIRTLLSAGSHVRDDVLALLFAADRLKHVHEEIMPLLEQGYVVISDRYTCSSLAYQGFVLPMEWVARINRYARPPDLTVFFEVSAHTALKRRSSRGGAEERFDALEKQERIAHAYAGALKDYPQQVGPVVYVDAEEDVAGVTRAVVSELLVVLQNMP